MVRTCCPLCTVIVRLDRAGWMEHHKDDSGVFCPASIRTPEQAKAMKGKRERNG